MTSQYGASALAEEASKVAHAETGCRNNQLVKSAYALGQLVESGDLDREEAETALQDAALSAGLAEREVKGTIQSGMKAGAANPRPQREPRRKQSKVKQARLKSVAVFPVPDGVPLPDCRYKGQAPSLIFEYRNAENQLLGLRVRYEELDASGQPVMDKNGKPGKQFRPWSYDGRQWGCFSLPDPLPLYNLPALATLPSDGRVLLTEGEHKADLAKAILGPTWAVLALHGGTAAARATDFAPLAGKTIYFWPDNDISGINAALTVSRRLRSIASALFILTPPPDMPQSWDCGDAIKSGWDKNRLEGFITANRLDPDAFITYAQETWKCNDTPKSESKATVIAISIEDFVTMSLPERKPIIDPILPRQGLAMIHAARGTGKTFVSLCLAYAVASGGSVFGWYAPKPARVLFIDGEMPGRALQDRLIQIAGTAKKAIDQRNMLRLITPDLQEDYAPMPNLATPEGQEAIEQEVSQADLIIIDNIATLCRYGRSNEEESWLPMQGWMLTQRKRGKSIILIHHSGKNGNQRGTSAHEDVLDTVIDLRQPPDYEPEQGARFEVHITKARSITGDAAKPFEAWLQSDFTWTVKDIEASKKDRLIELMASGMTNKELAEELGVSRATICRWKSEHGFTKKQTK